MCSKIKNLDLTRAVVITSLGLMLLVMSLLVLKFMPLKYEEISYYREVTLEPQQEDTCWFTVPKGYSASGTYSVASNNPVELTVSYQSTTTYLRYVICDEEGVSGTFSFKSEGYAIEEKYYLSLKNPSSGGFFGWGEGPTITVIVKFKVTSWTTYL